MLALGVKLAGKNNDSCRKNSDNADATELLCRIIAVYLLLPLINVPFSLA